MLIINFALAAILSLVITPAAIKLNILDKPNYRKIHDKPIPKGGGIGIFIPAVLLELNILLFFNNYVMLDVFKYFTIISVTIALMLVGIIDDKLELESKTKLYIQIVAAIFTLSSGIRFHTFDIMALDLLLTGAWIIGIVNAVNLIDGLDGLAAGIATISCIGFSVIGYAYGDKAITTLSLIIVGGCLGFLKYNFRPARIFMGDTGSVPLGYNLAIIGILCENVISGTASIIIPVIMLGIPIFDTMLTFTRRAINHKPIFQPDRSHFYNLIIDFKGIEHKKTVLIIYAINAVLITLSCALAFSNNIWRVASIFMIIATACLLSKKMGFIKTDSDYHSKNIR
jgi:UDP-GlcNAc:undecaprenyl-phosphate/decaprenyl-phosphate GlcNAc-1-phosphate transferase